MGNRGTTCAITPPNCRAAGRHDLAATIEIRCQAEVRVFERGRFCDCTFNLNRITPEIPLLVRGASPSSWISKKNRVNPQINADKCALAPIQKVRKQPQKLV